jgi:hypothetical protein
MMIGQGAPPSYARARDPPRRKVSRALSLSTEVPSKEMVHSVVHHVNIWHILWVKGMLWYYLGATSPAQKGSDSV